MRFLLIVVPALLSLAATVTAVAGDSPQFRGLHRDGRFDERGLLKAWPETGPPVAWVAKGVGAGFSSVSVAEGKVYVSGMTPDFNANLFVLSMNGTVERVLPYGKETAEKQAPGPRSTPTIDGGYAYLLSALGAVCCLDLANGAKAWEVNVLERFKGANPTWHLAESLLVAGERVICTPGGPGAGVVALNKRTGETVWVTSGLSDGASYCSPVVAKHNSRAILLTATAKLAVGIDADSGALLWTRDYPNVYDVHAAMPIYDKGRVYLSGGEGSGGGLLELSTDGSAATLKWPDTGLDCQHHGVVLVDGYLYGTSDTRGELLCVEMATGNVLWRTKEVRQGTIVCADGMLYIYEGPKTGVVSLVKATPTGFRRTGVFTVTEGTGNHWAHPTIANGRLYIRHGDAVIAYDVTEK